MKDFHEGLMSTNHILMQSLPHLSMPFFQVDLVSESKNLIIPKQCQIFFFFLALALERLTSSEFEFVSAQACETVV